MSTFALEAAVYKQFFTWYFHQILERPAPFTIFARRERETVLELVTPQKGVPTAGIVLPPTTMAELLRLRHEPRASDLDSRDDAAIALALATGARRSSLVGLTIYELGRPSDGLLGEAIRPASLEKGLRGRNIHFNTLRGYLNTVRRFIHGDRTVLASIGRRPAASPTEIVLGSDGRVAHLADGRTVNWGNVPLSVRHRLVDEYGRPVAILLSHRGQPLTAKSLYHIVARRSHRLSQTEGVPRLRLHDLRHCYASYLAAYHVTTGNFGPLPRLRGAMQTPNAIEGAIDLVMSGMGHAGRATTNLYTTSVSTLLYETPSRLVGEF